MTLAERLKQMRESRSLDHTQVASGANIPVTNVQKVEGGNKRKFAKPDQEKLEKFFDVAPGFFDPDEALAKPEKKAQTQILQYPATITVTRFSGKIVMDEMDNEGNSQDTETLEIIPFQTTPAQVGIQVQSSIQIIEQEWRGARVYIQKPCYREEIDDTLEWVARKAKERLELERREIILRAASEHFSGQPSMSEQQ